MEVKTIGVVGAGKMGNGIALSAAMADKTGIDPDGLKRTVEEYNGFCDRGFDPIFNKSPKLLRPIKTPKYYAGKFFAGRLW